MGVVEQSYATVESYLSDLDETYDSFSVNQTTVSVPSDRYEREREKARAGHVQLYAKVRNEDAEVLHIQDDDDLVLPSTATTDDRFEQEISATVENETGIDCHVVGTDEATIIGVRNADADESEIVYRLVVVFQARRQSDPTSDDVVWEQMPQRKTPVYV